MNTLDGLLAGIVAEPLEETRWLVLANWLAENDDPRRAELLRLHRRLLATCCEPDAHPERNVWQSRIVELLVAGVPPCVPQHTLKLPDGVPLAGSFIPPGSFLLGAGFDPEELPIHRVTFTRGFFMGVYPVTQSQWRVVMGTEPSTFEGPNRPVENVLWEECREFCTNLTAHLQGSATVWLPTEAEWEYACRAGTRSHYFFGNVLNPELANYKGDSSWNGSPKGQDRRQTTDVGSFPPNAWGLYDMHGNVWEWSADVYQPYASEARTDPKPVVEGAGSVPFVRRGGAWLTSPFPLRSGRRNIIGDGLLGRRPLGMNGFRVCFRMN